MKIEVKLSPSEVEQAIKQWLEGCRPSLRVANVKFVLQEGYHSSDPREQSHGARFQGVTIECEEVSNG